MLEWRGGKPKEKTENQGQSIEEGAEHTPGHAKRSEEDEDTSSSDED